MTDRLVIEIKGTLPEKGKHAIIAAAEVAAEKLAGDLGSAHDVHLTATVRNVRPGKGKTAAVVSGVTMVSNQLRSDPDLDAAFEAAGDALKAAE